MADDQEKTQKETKPIVRVEANVEELPIFSATKRSRRDEVVVWERGGRNPATGEAVNQKLTLRPAAGLGLPAEREHDLYYLVIAPFIEKNGFGEKGKIGPITFKNACEALGWTRTGPNYTQIKEAAKTLASLTVEFENCIVDGETRNLSGFLDHIFTRCAYYEESKKKEAEKNGEPYEFKRGEFILHAAEWFQKSYATNYLKPVNTGIYSKLKRALSKALFSYLDKRAWSAKTKNYIPEVKEDIIELRERFRLGTTKLYKLLQEFRLAHAELVEKWPVLREARVEKIKSGQYECVYIFDLQTELPLKEKARTEADPELVGMLTSRGIAKRDATHFVSRYSKDELLRVVDWFDQKKEAGELTENPQGWLWTVLDKGGGPPDDFVSTEERKKREKKAKAQQERQKQKEKEAHYREYLSWPIEKRISGDLFIWEQKFKRANQRDPSPEEREQVRQALISAEPERARMMFGDELVDKIQAEQSEKKDKPVEPEKKRTERPVERTKETKPTHDTTQASEVQQKPPEAPFEYDQRLSPSEEIRPHPKTEKASGETRRASFLSRIIKKLSFRKKSDTS